MAKPHPPLTGPVLDAARREAEAGSAMVARGQLEAACMHYQRAIQLQPDFAPFYYRLGVCEWRLDRLQAGEHLNQAVALDPQSTLAHAALASWSLQHGRVDAADQASKTALELSPEDNAAVQTRAQVLEVLGDLDTAWDLVQRLIQRGFVSMPLLILYGRMACYHEQQRQALDLVTRQLNAPTHSALDRAHLHFIAAELLDSLKRYDEAFEHARQANELTRVPYDPGRHEATINAFIAYFTRQRLSSLPRPRDRSNKPVFIVGMPRSGTSLVEQILASHPEVHAAGESEMMNHVWQAALDALSAGPSEYPACLDGLTTEQADALGQLYSRSLIAPNPGASCVTDKLPLNFLHVGLIAVLLPGARIIDCQRDPRDTCLSCFMTMFRAGHDFKFRLDHAAHFWRQYRRLMRHWNDAVDLPILEVSYESLIADPENQTRRMLDFLRLPWDERCLRFYESKRAVRTASLQQVRRPLYQSSLGRWRHYARHLRELDQCMS
ncbi:MAG TPA: sulfotransferase [Pirellulales bacterium]|nr:sulfotransferase [Pirellulales bacterium]